MKNNDTKCFSHEHAIVLDNGKDFCVLLLNFFLTKTPQYMNLAEDSELRGSEKW